MTTFQDGPAKGQNLMLTRAPVWLRVVTGFIAWDALDQLADTPAQGEKLYAYHLTAKPGMCHINRGRKGGGWYPIATYRIADPQPTDAQMRDAKEWADWCAKQKLCVLTEY